MKGTGNIKAQQAALVQSTNQGFIAIRNAELSYYTQYYSTFGLQAALMGGFAYAAFTQISYNGFKPESPSFIFTKELFWAASSICLAASMHILMTTIFLQVLGPGMALHGPIGSMARAADGMREETYHVFLAYMIMVIFFALVTILSFWVLMFKEAAIVSTLIFSLSGCLWWKFVHRIYNKFYVDPVAKNLLDDEVDNEDSDEQEITNNPMQQQHSLQSKSDLASASKADPSVKLAVRQIFSGSKTSKHVGDSVGIHNPSSEAASAISSGESRSGLPTNSASAAQQWLAEGYLSRKDPPSLFTSESWSRRYFVLKQNAALCSFASRSEFKDNLKGERPLDMTQYNTQATKTSEFFEIRLVSKDAADRGRNVVFRVDSAMEYEIWGSAMEKASQDPPST